MLGMMRLQRRIREAGYGLRDARVKRTEKCLPIMRGIKLEGIDETVISQTYNQLTFQRTRYLIVRTAVPVLPAAHSLHRKPSPRPRTLLNFVWQRSRSGVPAGPMRCQHRRRRRRQHPVSCKANDPTKLHRNYRPSAGARRDVDRRVESAECHCALYFSSRTDKGVQCEELPT